MDYFYKILFSQSTIFSLLSSTYHTLSWCPCRQFHVLETISFSLHLNSNVMSPFCLLAT